MGIAFRNVGIFLDVSNRQLVRIRGNTVEERTSIGAILRGLRGIRPRKNRRAIEQQANAMVVVHTEQELMNDFKKAFCACM